MGPCRPSRYCSCWSGISAGRNLPAWWLSDPHGLPLIRGAATSVPDGYWSEWLDTKMTGKTAVRQLLDALPELHLLPYEVADVNYAGNNCPELIEPVSAE